MKAIVVETRTGEAAVLAEDGTFRTVKGRYAVGETLDCPGKARPAFRKWMAAAAAAVVMTVTGGGFWYDANYAAYAEISLDVNPSIVYTVNRQSRVLGVRAVNEEAAQAVSALEEEGVRFMPVAEAIDRTMTFFENEGYLDAENEDYVLVNVSADNAGIQERVISEIEAGMGRAMERDPSMKYRVDYSDRATARRAEESDMSTGRYAVWEQEGAGREPREYAEMPVRELLGKPEEAPPESHGEDSAPAAPEADALAAPEAVAPAAPETDAPAVPEADARRQDDPILPDQQSAPVPETRQPETGGEPASRDPAPDARRNGDGQDPSSPSDGEGTRDGIPRGNPENAPDQPGNQPAR